MDATETLRYAAVVAFSAVPRRYGSTMLRNTVGTSITPRPFAWPVGVCRAGRCWAAVSGFGDELAGRGSLGSSFATVLSPRARNLKAQPCQPTRNRPIVKRHGRVARYFRNVRRVQCQTLPRYTSTFARARTVARWRVCTDFHASIAAASSSFLTTVFKTPSGFNRKFTWETQSFHLFTTPTTVKKTITMGASRADKELYFVKLRQLIEKYREWICSWKTVECN